MSVYYNEIDKRAAAWLRELMIEGLIPAGEIDERSIEDVAPVDLFGYTQCHFFAGIGDGPSPCKWQLDSQCDGAPGARSRGASITRGRRSPTKSLGFLRLDRLPRRQAPAS